MTPPAVPPTHHKVNRKEICVCCQLEANENTGHVVFCRSSANRNTTIFRQPRSNRRARCAVIQKPVDTGYVDSPSQGNRKMFNKNPSGELVSNCSITLSKFGQQKAHPSSSPVSSSCFSPMLKHWLCHFVQNRMCPFHAYTNSGLPHLFSMWGNRAAAYCGI